VTTKKESVKKKSRNERKKKKNTKKHKKERKERKTIPPFFSLVLPVHTVLLHTVMFRGCF
jgi:hypothetical protein